MIRQPTFQGATRQKELSTAALATWRGLHTDCSCPGRWVTAVKGRTAFVAVTMHCIAGNFRDRAITTVFAGLIFKDWAPSSNCHTHNAYLTTPPTSSSSCVDVNSRSVTRLVNGRSKFTFKAMVRMVVHRYILCLPWNSKTLTDSL